MTHVAIQRRSRAPYGAEGGAPGAMGRNLWVKQLRKEDGDLLEEGTLDPMASEDNKENIVPPSREPRIINIGGKATTFMGKGDHLIIETPGGGAWGATKDDNVKDEHRVQGVLDKLKGTIEWAARGSLAERAAQQAGFGGF